MTKLIIHYTLETACKSIEKFCRVVAAASRQVVFIPFSDMGKCTKWFRTKLDFKDKSAVDVFYNHVNAQPYLVPAVGT